jgi:hypothetical protein
LGSPELHIHVRSRFWGSDVHDGAPGQPERKALSGATPRQRVQATLQASRWTLATIPALLASGFSGPGLSYGSRLAFPYLRLGIAAQRPAGGKKCKLTG